MKASILALTVVLSVSAGHSQVATGGDYILEKTVISGGGGASGGPVESYTISGTMGQAAAGGPRIFLPFTKHLGFWTPGQLPATAAQVSIAGTLMTDRGQRVSGAVVTLTSSNGTVRRTLSDPLGNFRLTEVESGETYILMVSARRYEFTDLPMVVWVADDISDLQLTGTRR